MEILKKLEGKDVMIKSEQIADLNIIDNLTSTNATDVLSAKQGKLLDEKKANKNSVGSFSTPEAAIAALESQITGWDFTYLKIAATNINNNINGWKNTCQNVSTGGPNYQAFIAGTNTLYTAIITNYASTYIILFRRINNNYSANIFD